MSKLFLTLLFLLLSLGKNTYATNTLSLPNLFSDNMVLQRNAELQFWGKAAPFSKVTIETPWEVYSGFSDEKGMWNISIITPYKREPFGIEVCNQNDCKTLKNVLLGEVWLASGQSNMEMPLKGWLPNDPLLNSEEEIQNAHKFPVRFFTVKHAVKTQPQTNLEGKWEIASPEHAAYFSATAFFFARELSIALDVPVGIIHSSWGGTPVQSWIGGDGLRATGFYNEVLDQLPEFEIHVKNFEQWLNGLESFPSPFKSLPNEWSDQTKASWQSLSYKDLNFKEILYDDKDWSIITLPGDYVPDFPNDTTSDYDGIVWLRKTFVIDDPSEHYQLRLGLVDDMEFTYINGVMIGSTMGSDSFMEKSYSVPKGLLKKGENLISMRVIDTGGVSSILNPIILKSQSQEISLEGNWKALHTAELYDNDFYRLDFDNPHLGKRPVINKLTSWTPTGLYNAMINPLIRYTIRGAIWYQGESNVGSHDEYEIVFKEMINYWRAKWGYDFPFYFAQIAPFEYNNNLSPALRNAQLHVSDLDNTAMAITLDIGNSKNIHPANKQAVGQRLAALAFENTYGISGRYEASKPISIVREHDELVISFDCVKGGVTYKELKKEELEISSDNLNFYPADVRVEDCSIYVSSSEVQNPMYVRHAWSDVASGAIFNSLNIPISTFHLSTK
ncbi:MAG: sialate O-acetylesterase [Flavobacteriaceae bacterium]